MHGDLNAELFYCYLKQMIYRNSMITLKNGNKDRKTELIEIKQGFLDFYKLMSSTLFQDKLDINPQILI